MDAGFFKGTSFEQDARFADKKKKLMKMMRFEDVLSSKVDMNKVNLDVLKPWLSSRITELLTFEDDVLVEYVVNQLQVSQYPDPKDMQINMTGFLNAKNARVFLGELWSLLVSANENPGGVPAIFLEAKQDEIKKRKEYDDKYNEEFKRKITDSSTRSISSKEKNKSSSKESKVVKAEPTSSYVDDIPSVTSAPIVSVAAPAPPPITGPVDTIEAQKNVQNLFAKFSKQAIEAYGEDAVKEMNRSRSGSPMLSKMHESSGSPSPDGKGKRSSERRSSNDDGTRKSEDKVAAKRAVARKRMSSSPESNAGSNHDQSNIKVFRGRRSCSPGYNRKYKFRDENSSQYNRSRREDYRKSPPRRDRERRRYSPRRESNASPVRRRERSDSFQRYKKFNSPRHEKERNRYEDLPRRRSPARDPSARNTERDNRRPDRKRRDLSPDPKDKLPPRDDREKRKEGKIEKNRRQHTPSSSPEKPPTKLKKSKMEVQSSSSSDSDSGTSDSDASSSSSDDEEPAPKSIPKKQAVSPKVVHRRDAQNDKRRDSGERRRSSMERRMTPPKEARRKVSPSPVWRERRASPPQHARRVSPSFNRRNRDREQSRRGRDYHGGDRDRFLDDRNSRFNQEERRGSERYVRDRRTELENKGRYSKSPPPYYSKAAAAPVMSKSPSSASSSSSSEEENGPSKDKRSHVKLGKTNRMKKVSPSNSPPRFVNRKRQSQRTDSPVLRDRLSKDGRDRGRRTIEQGNVDSSASPDRRHEIVRRQQMQLESSPDDRNTKSRQKLKEKPTKRPTASSYSVHSDSDAEAHSPAAEQRRIIIRKEVKSSRRRSVSPALGEHPDEPVRKKIKKSSSSGNRSGSESRRPERRKILVHKKESGANNSRHRKDSSADHSDISGRSPENRNTSRNLEREENEEILRKKALASLKRTVSKRKSSDSSSDSASDSESD